MKLDDKVLLGAARVMLFKDDHVDDDNVWQLFVQEGGEEAPQSALESEGRKNMTLGARKKPKATSGPKNAPSGDPLPFDDPVPEILL